MSTTQTVHDFAITYTLNGFSVIPLKHKEKTPFLKSWLAYQQSPPTTDEIDYWFKNSARNIGIVTGAVSGIIVLDIDGPEGKEALQAIVGRYGDLPPTWISTTGKGMHYIFKHPNKPIRNSASRKLGIDFRADGGYIVAPPSIHPSGLVYQWAEDSAKEIADAPEWLVEWMTGDRQPSWIAEILTELGRIEKKTSSKQDKKTSSFQDIKTGNKAHLILEQCAFCAHCKTDATSLSEPEWYAMISNIARADGGRELVHELSKPHPKYSATDTDAKITHATTQGEPHSCEYIQTHIGFTGCPENGCGVKAPVVFGVSEIHESLLIMKKLCDSLEVVPSVEAIFQEDIYHALASIRSRDLGKYAVLKNKLKSLCKDLSVRDLETTVKQTQEKIERNQLQSLTSQAVESSKNILQEYNLGFDVIQPSGWKFTMQGVFPIDLEGDMKPILPVPLFLTKRIINADTAEEKVQISFVRDGALKEISVARPVAFNKSQIVALSTHALPVTSENAKDVINYLHDFEAANMETLPVTKAVSRMGWIGQSNFMPGFADGIELDVEPGMSSIAGGYGSSGELETWIATMREARKSPIVRLMMAASFAAPMLKLVGHRVFLLHVWGASRGGKTAALKAALSVWGDPETIMASFNSTRVGIERLAGFYCDLPLGIDERQIVGNKQELIEQLVYLIGMGKGKTRGTKGGGIQAASTWRTIALTTGEEPLSGDSSNTGIRTRTIEIYGLPFTDERLASQVHQVTKDHYGHAGEKFIKELIETNSLIKDAVKEQHQVITDHLQEIYQNHMGATISQLAMLAIGDIWASITIFGDDPEQSQFNGIELVKSFANQIATSVDADEALIGAQKLQSWLNANVNSFDEKVFNRTGFREMSSFSHTKCWYIYSHKFDEIMKELNFNPSRMLRDWSKNNWIKTKREGDRVRYRIKHWDDLIKCHTEFVAFVGVDSQKND